MIDLIRSGDLESQFELYARESLYLRLPWRIGCTVLYVFLQLQLVQSLSVVASAILWAKVDIYHRRPLTKILTIDAYNA